MKKILLLSAALFAFGAVARAQVSIIPRGGLTRSTISFKETTNFIQDRKTVQPTAGVTSGIGVNVPLAKDGAFSVQPELLYVQKGYRVEFADQWGSRHSREQFNYLEVPVLARYTLGIRKFKLYVNTGPSLAYALNGQYEFITRFGVAPTIHSGKSIFGKRPPTYWGPDRYYEPKHYNRFDVGVQFGGGAGFALGPGTLLLDARYGMGLGNFYKGDKSDYDYPIYDQEPNIKTRVFALTLGYAIPLGGR
jgi:hypothetical protein